MRSNAEMHRPRRPTAICCWTPCARRHGSPTAARAHPADQPTARRAARRPGGRRSADSNQSSGASRSTERAPQGPASPADNSGVDRVHEPTWLCPDAASRERLLDMDERLRRPRAVAFGLIAIGILAAAPLIGWWGLGLLVVAVLGFRLAQGIAERIHAPEHALFASWAVSELVIAGSVAVTGGITSYTASWLLVPLVTLPARFGTRGLGVGVAFIGALVTVIAVAIEPSQPLPPIYALFALLTTLTAVAVLSTALMRSDVDHRTEAVIDGLTGMLNRRALDQRLHELTAQAQITG